MALLKSGSTVGGNLIWHQGLLPLFPSNNSLYYKDFLVFTKNNLPNNVDVGLGNVTNDAQVKKAGDTMTGDLTINTTGNAILNVKGVRLRSDPSNQAILSAEDKSIYLRPKGTDVTAQQAVLDTDGALTVDRVLTRSVQPGAAGSLTRKDYVDGKVSDLETKTTELANTKVAKSGDTMTGNLTAPVMLASAGQNSAANALTRKDYVDGRANEKVAKSGDTMTGRLNANAGISIQTDTLFEFSRNTDFARISFKNDSDQDTDSYMNLVMGDNGNEYFKFSAITGTTQTEWARIRFGDVQAARYHRAEGFTFNPNTGKTETTIMTQYQPTNSNVHRYEIYAGAIDGNGALTGAMRRDMLTMDIDNIKAASAAQKLTATIHGKVIAREIFSSTDPSTGGFSVESRGNERSNGLFPGNGDGATWDTCNVDIKSWYGIGFRSDLAPGTRTVVINARTGDITSKGMVSAPELMATANNISIRGAGNRHLRFQDSAGGEKAIIWAEDSNQLNFRANGNTMWLRPDGRLQSNRGFFAEGVHNWGHGWGDVSDIRAPFAVDHGNTGTGGSYYPALISMRQGNGYRMSFEFGQVAAGGNWGQGIIRIRGDNVNGQQARWHFLMDGILNCPGQVNAPTFNGNNVTGGLVKTTGDIELNRGARRHIRFMDGSEADGYIYKDAGNNPLRINLGRFGNDWQFQTDGTFYSSGNGNFNNVYIRSDERLKKNFRKIENATDKVEQLMGYVYDKKITLDAQDYTETEAGIIAQSLQKVLPEAVTEKEGVLNVSSAGVNALLINAINELTKRVRELENK